VSASAELAKSKAKIVVVGAGGRLGDTSGLQI